MEKLHWHHTIPIKEIDWHLANLWEVPGVSMGGYRTLIPMTKKAHQKHHSKKSKKVTITKNTHGKVTYVSFHGINGKKKEK